MSTNTLTLESRKIKRTGYLPAFLGGGLLAAMVPVVNMSVRWETYTSLPGSPFHILMDANWQLMAQLNILLLVCGACILYHTEYAENGIQKAETLPLRPFRLFLGKLEILFLSSVLPLCLETVSMLLCCAHWFPESAGDGILILEGMAFELALLLPTGAVMVAISSMCRNMWVSLGAGVILVFLSSMLPHEVLAAAMVPFSAPYEMLHRLPHGDAPLYLAVCAGEIVLLSGLELTYIKIRRCFA